MVDDSDVIDPETLDAVDDEVEDVEPVIDDAEDDGPVTVRIEGVEEEEVEQAPIDLIRHLRGVIAEQGKKLKEQSKPEAQAEVDEMPPRPARADFDYDDDRYDDALDKWHESKREWQDRENARKDQQKKVETKWQETVEAYNGRKAALKVDDFDAAETAVAEVFDHMRIGVIVEGCSKPELVIYALGKNPAKLKEFAAIESVAKFGIEIGKFEEKLKVERKAPPAPEGTIKGSGKVSGAVDATLDRLRAKAEQTGDYSEVAAYKRKMA